MSEFQEVAEFAVQRPDTGAAGCVSDIKGSAEPVCSRSDGKSKALTESALADRVKSHQNGLNALFAEPQ